MADKPIIKENSELLKRIVAEKGYFGYRDRYREILLRLISQDTVYEDLSDENKEILHFVTGLTEDKLQTLSGLVYSKPDDEADARKTRIGCVMSLPKYRPSMSYKPLPEDKRQNALAEYISFLGLSLQMLRVQDHPEKGRDLFFYFRYAVRDYYQDTYPDIRYNGLLHLFNGNVIIDLTLYDIAVRMDKTRERAQRDVISPFFGGQFATIKEYNDYRGPLYSCKDMDQFCQKCNYVDFTFPEKDIKKFFSTEEMYIGVRNSITETVLNSLNISEIEECKREVERLTKEFRDEKIPNTGITGKWKDILKRMLDELPSVIRSRKANSTLKGLSDKMKIYLLDLLTSYAFEGATKASPINRIYANIMERSERPIDTSRGRLSKDKTAVDATADRYLYHYNNLDYSRYSERVRNLEAIYNLLNDLDDDIEKKGALIGTLVRDLIPYEKDKETSMETLKKGGFKKMKLQRMVEKAIDDYYENPPKIEV